MSTRFPLRISAPVNKEIHLATTNRKFFKPWLVDAVFLGMVVASVIGLTYALLH